MDNLYFSGFLYCNVCFCAIRLKPIEIVVFTLVKKYDIIVLIDIIIYKKGK